MSILIKGMEMPKGEKAVHLEIHSDGMVLMWQMGDSDKVVGKAIPILPHGRLIEESKVLDIVFEWCPDDDGSVGKVGDLREMLDEIEALPTIIPAEEGDT